MNTKRRRRHDKLASLPGVKAVRRPVHPDTDEHFDLFYVRAGRNSTQPVVIMPGGPGVASVRLYRGLRRRAAAAGVDVLMIEHRGIGMSRHTDSGADLPPEAITVDQVLEDVAAVLDDAAVSEAVLYGTSYGSYLAAGFGVRHRARVAAMILDSPLLSTGDLAAMRTAIRDLLWDGAYPQTATLAPKVRRLVDDGTFEHSGGQLAGLLYGFGGAPLLDRQLDLLLRGRTLVWSALRRLDRLTTRKTPYRNETDLVARIAFRELDYAGTPDGLPLDPALEMRETAGREPAFGRRSAALPAEPDIPRPTTFAGRIRPHHGWLRRSPNVNVLRKIGHNFAAASHSRVISRSCTSQWLSRPPRRPG